MAAHAIPYDSCRTYFLDRFEKVIFPYWEGTRWDYNGYTNTPGQDKVIACGYFVSTTLKHMGFNWNRYDLAKLYSHDMVEQTCSGVRAYSDLTTLLATLEKQGDNLYMVGLDNHVGLLLKRQSHSWFIHSNYINSMGPIMEKASDSRAFASNSNYKIGFLLSDAMLEKWLKGTLITFTR